MKLLKTSLLAALLLAAPIVLADSKPAVDTTSATLGQVTSFEVEAFPRWEFGVDNGRMDPELLEYARRELEKDNRLTTGSPGEAVLRFVCVSAGCYKIRAEVTLGKDGPVIWQTMKTYTRNPFRTFRNNHGLAEEIIDSLAADYEKSAREVPVKIDIKAED